MTHDNDTNETFTRTSPPLNRFTVKLPLGGVGQAPWEILTAADARVIARLLHGDTFYGVGRRVETILTAYADAVDAMTPGHPERDMQTTIEALGY